MSTKYPFNSLPSTSERRARLEPVGELVPIGAVLNGVLDRLRCRHVQERGQVSENYAKAVVELAFADAAE